MRESFYRLPGPGVSHLMSWRAQTFYTKWLSWPGTL